MCAGTTGSWRGLPPTMEVGVGVPDRLPRRADPCLAMQSGEEEAGDNVRQRTAKSKDTDPPGLGVSKGHREMRMGVDIRPQNLGSQAGGLSLIRQRAAQSSDRVRHAFNFRWKVAKLDRAWRLSRRLT